MCHGHASHRPVPAHPLPTPPPPLDLPTRHPRPAPPIYLPSFLPFYPHMYAPCTPQISEAFEGALVQYYVSEEEREHMEYLDACVREEAERKWMPEGDEDDPASIRVLPVGGRTAAARASLRFPMPPVFAMALLPLPMPTRVSPLPLQCPDVRWPARATIGHPPRPHSCIPPFSARPRRASQSANKIFFKIRSSLTRCSKNVSRGATLVALAQLFKRVLSGYAQVHPRPRARACAHALWAWVWVCVGG